MRISDVVGGVFVGFALCFAHIVGAAQKAERSADGVWSAVRDFQGYYEPKDHWLAEYPEYACILAQCIVLEPERFAEVVGSRGRPVGELLKERVVDQWNHTEFRDAYKKNPSIHTVARFLDGVILSTIDTNTSLIGIMFMGVGRGLPMFSCPVLVDAASLESFMLRTMMVYPEVQLR